MFFLLPVIAGAAATAVGAGEIAVGLSAAVGIGAAVKGAIDTKEAREIRENAEEKFSIESEKLRAEAKRSQRKAEEFGRMKKRIYSGLLKDTVLAVRNAGDRSMNILMNTCTAKILEKDIERFEKRFEGETPFPSLIRSAGIEPVMSGILQNAGVFGSGVASLSFVPHLLPTMLGIAKRGSRMLIESERFAGTVEIECEKIAAKTELCRALRKRIMEGMKIVGFLSEKLSEYLDKISKIGDAENVLSDDEADTLFNRTMTLAVALKKAMEAEICRTDGTLIDKTERYFQKLMREDW